jgi:hypothetical protein
MRKIRSFLKRVWEWEPKSKPRVSIYNPYWGKMICDSINAAEELTKGKKDDNKLRAAGL